MKRRCQMEKQELTVDEIKRIEVDILDFVTDVAKRNNIRCFLDGGTLLGAVRHNGFIPWDDDIDVIVPRKDYKRFLDCIKNTQSQYKVLSMYDNDDYFYPFAKVIDSTTELIEFNVPRISGYGIYIDIFPLDNIPPNAKEMKAFHRKIERFRWISSRSLRKQSGNYSLSLRNIVILYFADLYGWKKANRKINALCESTADMKTQYACDIVAARKPHFVAPAECFAEETELIFEGKHYIAPKGYDSYLSALYGNYMELPPVEQRVSNHNFRAWRLLEGDNT